MAREGVGVQVYVVFQSGKPPKLRRYGTREIVSVKIESRGQPSKRAKLSITKSIATKRVK